MELAIYFGVPNYNDSGCNLEWGRYDGNRMYNQGLANTPLQEREWGVLGLDQNYFSARFYDPTIGRWHAVDPLEQFHSPYIAMCNDPANNIDPDGRAGTHLIDRDFGLFAASSAAISVGLLANYGKLAAGIKNLFAVGGPLHIAVSHGAACFGAVSAASTVGDLVDGNEVGADNCGDTDACSIECSNSELSKVTNSIENSCRMYDYENGSRIFIESGAHGDLLNTQMNIAFNYFAYTNAWADLVNATSTNSLFDVYFKLDNGNSTFDANGFRDSGVGGSTSTVEIVKSEWSNNLTKGDHYSTEMIESINRTFQQNRSVLVINLDKNYLSELFMNQSELLRPFDADRYVNTLEDLLHTLSHEVHAHAINDITGKSRSGNEEHGIYNHDHKLGNNSPPYKDTPTDGKSGASKDKLNVQSVLKYYRIRLKSYGK